MGLLDQVLGNASKIDATEVQSEFAVGRHINLALNAEDAEGAEERREKLN
jgi:hypothetical protein